MVQPFSAAIGDLMLKLENVTRRFTTFTAVDAVSLTFPVGQMVGVIGRSGAGKSTLLRMLNRLIDPSGVVIRFDGIDVTRLRGSIRRRDHRLPLFCLVTVRRRGSVFQSELAHSWDLSLGLGLL